MKILVAEDSRTQAAHLRRILEDEGFVVETTFDGQAALEAARKGGVDLVLSDVVMPKLGGYDLVRALRADATTRGLPIVLMTSLNQPEDVVRALAAGADNFVNKPYAPAELVARLRRTMASRTFGLAKLDVTLQGEKYHMDQPPATILAVLLSALEDSAKRERELEASRKKLTESTMERERFLSVVAHELRTPLNVLAMRASLEGRMREKSRVSTGEPLPDVVTRQVGKMVALLDDLLDTARIDQGDLRIEPRTSDLVALAKEAISAARLPGTHDLRLEAPPSLLVLLDPARIGQVLNNFLTNALKYAAKDSVVTMTVALSGEGQTARVDVRDEGIGIGAEDLPHVFDRYFRSEAGRKASKGLGLGLAICRQIVELHDGLIGVDSEEGKGSDFWFELPGVVTRERAETSNGDSVLP